MLDKLKYLKQHKEEIIKSIQSLTIENVYNSISYLANANELLAKSIKNNNIVEFYCLFQIIKKLVNGLLTGIQNVIQELNKVSGIKTANSKHLLYKLAGDMIDLFIINVFISDL